MGFPRRRDLVQRAARQTAAKRRVDGFDAERLAPGVGLEPGCSFQRPQVLPKLLDHHYPFEDAS